MSSTTESFFVSFVFYDEIANLTRWIGVAALFISLFVFGRGTSQPAQESNEVQKQNTNRGFILALSALILLGTSQSILMIPSYWENWKDVTGLRLPLMFFGQVILNGAIVVLWQKPKT